MRRWIIGLVSHAAALAIGFALGVYFLPVLTAPAAPAPAALAAAAADARFTGTFNRDRPGSDFLHWGEGTVSLSARRTFITVGWRRARITSSTWSTLSSTASSPFSRSSTGRA